jgi:hypothetical protein
VPLCWQSDGSDREEVSATAAQRMAHDFMWHGVGGHRQGKLGRPSSAWTNETLADRHDLEAMRNWSMGPCPRSMFDGVRSGEKLVDGGRRGGEEGRSPKH